MLTQHPPLLHDSITYDSKHNSSAITDKCSDDLDHDPFSMTLRKKKATTAASPLLTSNNEEMHLSQSRRLSSALRDSMNIHDAPASSNVPTTGQWATASTTGRSAVHEWGRAGSITVDRLAVSLHGGEVGGGSSSQSEKIQAAIQERRRSAMLPMINNQTGRRPRYIHQSLS